MESEEVYMTSKEYFTAEEAKRIGESLGIDWSKYDVEQYMMGLEHFKMLLHLSAK